MYVAVLHTIHDPELMAKGREDFDRRRLPEGFENPVSVVGVEADYAFSLWVAPSVEELRELLDPLTPGATNLYFAVDPAAFGTYGFPIRETMAEVGVPVGLL